MGTKLQRQMKGEKGEAGAVPDSFSLASLASGLMEIPCCVAFRYVFCAAVTVDVLGGTIRAKPRCLCSESARSLAQVDFNTGGRWATWSAFASCVRRITTLLTTGGDSVLPWNLIELCPAPAAGPAPAACLGPVNSHDALQSIRIISFVTALTRSRLTLAFHLLPLTNSPSPLNYTTTFTTLEPSALRALVPDIYRPRTDFSPRTA
nr:hypothetical protein CFP56_22136 [Quercus suber]